MPDETPQGTDTPEIEMSPQRAMQLVTLLWDKYTIDEHHNTPEPVGRQGDTPEKLALAMKTALQMCLRKDDKVIPTGISNRYLDELNNLSDQILYNLSEGIIKDQSDEEWRYPTIERGQQTPSLTSMSTIGQPSIEVRKDDSKEVQRVLLNLFETQTAFAESQRRLECAISDFDGKRPQSMWDARRVEAEAE